MEDVPDEPTPTKTPADDLAEAASPPVPKKQTWWDQLPERWRMPAFAVCAGVILFLGIVFRQPLAIIIGVAIALGTAAMIHDARKG